MLSINRKAYYYFKCPHLPGEGTHGLPAEVNGVSVLAGALFLGKNLKDTDLLVLSAADNVQI